MSGEVDKLVELAQQLFPQPRSLPKIYTRGWSQPGFPQAPEDESKLPANHLIIELVPLTAPERPVVPGHRTYGEPQEPVADDAEEGESKLTAMLRKMAEGTAGL